MEGFHQAVLLKEVLEYLDPKSGNVIFDGTLGGGGHALALAEKIAPDGLIIATDLDPAALESAEKKFADAGVKTKHKFIHANYRDILEILVGEGITAVDAIIADVGVSSYDFEGSGRGFSFQKAEDLDMRFNPEFKASHKLEPRTAKFLISSLQQFQLEEIFRDYGEEKFSRNIARAIVKARQEREIQTTTDLFEIIKKALPAPVRYKAGDSARRIFQALRIAVNHELENLEEFLPAAFSVLKPGGRIAIISFHSLEDRIVKQYFAAKAKGCICPPNFPQCVCGKNPEGKILTRKVIKASAEETEKNRRALPAKMRVLEKI